MKTLILPGFSPSNEEWADGICKELNLKNPTEVIKWKHWKAGSTEDDWINKEAQRAIDKIEDYQVNILAKSLGTLVAMIVLRLKSRIINKLILCGIPLTDLNETNKLMYEPLKRFSGSDVLCIQSQNDNHGSHLEAEKFVHSINPKIRIISKPRDDHNYPYPEDFINFLR